MSEGVALNELVFDKDGQVIDYRVLDVNPAYYHSADYQGTQVVGHTATQLYGMSPEVIRRFWEEHRNRRDVVQTEYVSPLRGHTFLISTSPFVEDRFVTTFFDITEYRRLEEAADRNARLESIALLAGGIAHDFNNLLAGLYGHLELAERMNQSKDVAGVLHRALETIDRARSLTGQLLTFARGGEPEKRAGYLFPLAQDAVTFALVGSGVRCDFHVPDHLWSPHFDPAQITQVIENVVRNARQAMNDAGLLEVSARNVVVSAGTVAGLAPGRYICLSIRDHGPGMTEQVREHIFDPFFTTKETGVGLGMSRAFSIMKRHGGTIELESSPGRGSAFHLYLQAAEKQEEARSPSAGTEATEASDCGKILVMDDEKELRDSLAVLLRMLGYSVVMAGDGDEAVRAFRAAAAAGEPIAVVLLDLTIPGGKGGLEAAREIRAQDPKVRILLMTGYASESVRDEMAACGIDGLLQKPFQLKELERLLQSK